MYRDEGTLSSVLGHHIPQQDVKIGNSSAMYLDMLYCDNVERSGKAMQKR